MEALIVLSVLGFVLLIYLLHRHGMQRLSGILGEFGFSAHKEGYLRLHNGRKQFVRFIDEHNYIRLICVPDAHELPNMFLPGKGWTLTINPTKILGEAIPQPKKTFAAYYTVERKEGAPELTDEMKDILHRMQAV